MRDDALPRTGGFDPEALARVPEALAPFVERGDLPGVVTLTWRGGETAQVNAVGSADLEGGVPMRRDTLFRIASMTKPVTSAAAMMLVEEGKWALSDPITKWAPEFAGMPVLLDPAGPLDQTQPAARDITVEDLLTHRSGLAYGFTSRGPIAKAHEEVLGSVFDPRMDPDTWMAALATLPLSFQPGSRLHYSHATEVLGFLVARIEGKPLGDVLRERVFGPLGMADTDFWAPPAKRDRLAKLYGWDEAAQKLKHVPMPLHDQAPVFSQGGGGLISCVDDYLKFARMLLNDGEVDGVRLLKPETVRDMRTNRLTAEQRSIDFLGMPMWAGMGFGLGLSVVDDPSKNLMGVGSPGSFGWPGAFGTWWQADPVKDLILIFMIQHSMPLNPDAGAQIALGRGMAGRMALPAFQQATYAALA
jgi:CubicO group peptidase (beta-lactamase class C family)